ncbi:efflux transporter periplasmic adaptor subunit [Chitinophaga caeni]|uniref:Efflux transporter periplasmic adaptor subunit n=2 Tax=Chitinophaga caeni TaxID=2029983 RepID=A0A291QUX1_9BACT|nr:efflux transporter periplasmic adaptor subunit [Chitinophaga caeni]
MIMSNNINKWIFIFLAIPFSWGCSQNNKATQESAQAMDSTGAHTDEHISSEVVISDLQYNAIGVQEGAITRRTLSHLLKVNGVLDVPPQNMVDVAVPMGGYIKNTELLEGMKIRKGQLLATLENMEYIQLQQDYLENASQLAYLETEYKRQQELSAAEISATKVLQQAKAQYLTTKARVDGLRKKLQFIGISPANIEKNGISPTIQIYSPINGYVFQVNVNIGKYVTPNDVLFKIVDADHLHAELTVFERDVNSIRMGQTVRLSLPNETKERLAKVYLIGKVIDAERTVRVHCHLEQEDENLIPGMFVKAFIETAPADQWALPSNAVVDFEGANYVFIKKKGSQGHEYDFVPVNVTAESDDYKGVQLPDEVDPEASTFVLKGAYDLLAALKTAEGGDHGH